MFAILVWLKWGNCDIVTGNMAANQSHWHTSRTWRTRLVKEPGAAQTRSTPKMDYYLNLKCLQQSIFEMDVRTFWCNITCKYVYFASTDMPNANYALWFSTAFAKSGRFYLIEYLWTASIVNTRTAAHFGKILYRIALRTIQLRIVTQKFCACSAR